MLRKRTEPPAPIVAEEISHNATRREGDTLIWEYTMARFEELSKKKNPEDFGVRVTYRR